MISKEEAEEVLASGEKFVENIVQHFKKEIV